MSSVALPIRTPGPPPPPKRDTGRAIRPLVVDENTGQRVDLRRVRMVARPRDEATPADS